MIDLDDKALKDKLFESTTDITFKHVIESLLTPVILIGIMNGDNPEHQKKELGLTITKKEAKELHNKLREFKNSELELFKQDIGNNPINALVASATMGKYYPLLAETFLKVYCMNEDLDYDEVNMQIQPISKGEAA